MITQHPRDPWRIIWRILISDYLMAALLLGLALGLASAVWLPQMPASNPVAYAQWLSNVQARFRDAASTMQALGLFSITRSFFFRVLLALLASVLALRLVESIEQLQRSREIVQPAKNWREVPGVNLSDAIERLRRRRYRTQADPSSSLTQVDRWPWAELGPVFVYGGALVILLGLLIGDLWGWQESDIILQGGDKVTVSETGQWVALDKGSQHVTTSYGIVPFIQERGPGINVQAEDDTGQSLSLRQAIDAQALPQLTLALTEDQYFAIPEAHLIVRLIPQPNQASVLVQVYRSPPGELKFQAVVEDESNLTVEGVTLAFTSVPYVRLMATFNPGFWPIVFGLVVLITGVLSKITWPVRRSWLKEKDAQVQVAGDSVPTLVKGQGDGN